MRKKSRVILIVLLLLVITSILLYITDVTNTFGNYESNFAIKDTSTVTRIFLTDKANNRVELIKKAPGDWMVNNQYHAINDEINVLLKTLPNLDVRAKVSKAEHDNVIGRMAAIGIKVEIYQQSFRFSIGNSLNWFPYEKLAKVYYVGDATKDNLGTFMLMDGAEHPYIVQIRGFNGFLFSRYSTKTDDWRDHSIFNYRLNDIKEVSLEFPGSPEKSWRLKNPDNRNFELYTLQTNKKVAEYDTMKIIDYLGSFWNVKFETFQNKINIKDSILKSSPFCILSLTDVNGKTARLKTYHKKANPGEADLKGNPIYWDRDRLFAKIEETNDFVLIQYFIFDKILRQLDYFYKNSNTNNGSFKVIY